MSKYWFYMALLMVKRTLTIVRPTKQPTDRPTERANQRPTNRTNDHDQITIHDIYFILFQLTAAAPAWHIPSFTRFCRFSLLFLAYIYIVRDMRNRVGTCVFAKTSHDVEQQIKKKKKTPHQIHISFLFLQFYFTRALCEQKPQASISIRTMHVLVHFKPMPMQLDKLIWCHKLIEIIPWW